MVAKGYLWPSGKLPFLSVIGKKKVAAMLQTYSGSATCTPYSLLEVRIYACRGAGMHTNTYTLLLLFASPMLASAHRIAHKLIDACVPLLP